VTNPSRRSATRPGLGQRRLRLMECQTVGDDGVVMPLDQGDQSRLQWHVRFVDEVDRMAGTAQQALHLARPVFLLDLDQCLEFPQMMGIAQRMQHAFQRVVGMPVVMHHHAGEVCQQAAAFRRDPIEGQQHGRGDVQPLCFAANAKPGLVEVLDRCRGHVVAHRLGEALEAFGTILANPGDGGGDQMHAEQIGHQRGQTLLRQQLVMQRYNTKLPIRSPYCTGALTQSGKAARV
jgi:hypothetical protein